MQKIILYIQPQLRFTTTAQDFERVDLMEEDLISLTQVIQDVKSIDKVFTDFSQTFNLPASKTNNKLFKYWYNPDVQGFDNQIMANARIELNHFAFKEGKIRLESVTMRNNVPSLYKVTFFGNTVKLNDLIGEDKIENLNWLNNFNHEFSNSNVKNGLSLGLNFTVDSVSYPDAIIYPLIAHSQQYIYDATNNTDSGLNISTNATQNNKRGVFPEDLKPALLVKHIIKAIEEQYSLTFKTGEFFDSSTMNNFYMWLHREKGRFVSQGNVLIDNQSFTCVSSTANCNHFSDSTYNAFFNTSKGTYTFFDTLSAGLGIPEEFDFAIDVTPSNLNNPYTIEIVDVLTDTVYATAENLTGNDSINTSFGNNAFTTVQINTNQTYEIAARIKSNFTMTFDVAIQIDHRFEDASLGSQIKSATFDADSSTIALVSDMIISREIPDIKVLDFLNGLFKMFNLTSFVNFEGEIVVQKLDDFYNGGDTLDITEYIKTDEHSVNNTIPFSEVDFEYSEPKSILAQTFLNTNNRKYGEVEYKTNASDKKVYKVTAPFEHMLFSRLSDLTANTLTDIQTGCFLDEELNPSIGQPLLFYGIQRSGIGTAINFIYNTRPETYGALADSAASGSDIFSLTNYYMPHHANELGSRATAPSINLNFGSEIDTYNLTDYGGNNNSLFQLNYEDYITDVFSKKARLYKFSAVLPLKILLQLTLDDKIIIGTRLYKINSMTTKLQSGETEFELLNDV
tara:strand:- start:10358 stop:12568 length:2211 start_codon:yes stop_codon:yes gene_type:complete